eukprot:Gb_36411 [translate_table: standard]
MEPSNLFRFNTRIRNCESIAPIHLGMFPDKLLFPMSKISNFEQF